MNRSLKIGITSFITTFVVLLGVVSVTGATWQNPSQPFPNNGTLGAPISPFDIEQFKLGALSLNTGLGNAVGLNVRGGTFATGKIGVAFDNDGSSPLEKIHVKGDIQIRSGRFFPNGQGSTKQGEVLTRKDDGGIKSMTWADPPAWITLYGEASFDKNCLNGAQPELCSAFGYEYVGDYCIRDSNPSIHTSYFARLCKFPALTP